MCWKAAGSATAPIANTPDAPPASAQSGPETPASASSEAPIVKDKTQPEAETPNERTFSNPAEAFLLLDREARLSVIASLSARRAKAPDRGLRRRLDQALKTAYRTKQLVGFARERERESLVIAFAEALELEPSIVRQMIDDRSGEPLVLMLRALGLPPEEANQVLLLANPAIGTAVETFFRMVDLYAGMEANVAEALVATWRLDGERSSAPRHQPQFSDAEGVRRPAARAVSPAQGQTAAEPLRRSGER